MKKKPSKKSVRKNPGDVNQLAHSIMEQIAQIPAGGKNPAAVALGRLGGLKGGKARAEKLSSEKRREIAIKAARSRWSKK